MLNKRNFFNFFDSLRLGLHFRLSDWHRLFCQSCRSCNRGNNSRSFCDRLDFFRRNLDRFNSGTHLGHIRGTIKAPCLA